MDGILSNLQSVMLTVQKNAAHMKKIKSGQEELELECDQLRREQADFRVVLGPSSHRSGRMSPMQSERTGATRSGRMSPTPSGRTGPTPSDRSESPMHSD